jgi:hypothetical protein
MVIPWDGNPFAMEKSGEKSTMFDWTHSNTIKK